jgi:hypothetical protein
MLARTFEALEPTAMLEAAWPFLTFFRSRQSQLNLPLHVV